MIPYLLAATMLATPIDCTPRGLLRGYHEARLSEAERDRIYQEIHLAVTRMYDCLDNADFYAGRISNIDVRNACKAAIQGAIAGLAGRNAYSVVIGACLGSLANIGGSAYEYFLISRDCVRDAEYYAWEADRLQERLWRDE